MQVHAETSGSKKPLTECDPIQLAIFSHRWCLRPCFLGAACFSSCHSIVSDIQRVCLYFKRAPALDCSGPAKCHGAALLCLSIWRRFMGIAEQMGRVLQRTSISVNIKERLDFSCALFGPNGSLVANAPHLPVHLGAMSEAICYQVTTSIVTIVRT